ncbi:hypothetical protein GIW79_22850 [Pseudomonas sp. PA-7-1E]|uniref:hypothetical protein n=1 Tax=Gammaproteobacteria TaxID=1236 RepID=UPI001933E2B5|nr:MULTISPECIES: hypothetical protein [Gammaproteobacteria]MBM0557867.1 hypothetical protein [Escherichia coli]MCF4988344.1 hypothetical protein [Pseudomonas gessardii]MCF5043291.1 hypothetical protein [Pseudomonas sp. PA-7-1E]MCF5131270.1 hypothetical protein [Pseudomonas sp. PA-6-4F]
MKHTDSQEEAQMIDHLKGQQEREKPEVISAMRSSMWSSVQYVAIGLGILAACVAFIALMVFLARVVPPVWYGWARIITSDYSSVTPALWINWVSLVAAGWAFGVAYKLGNANFQASQWFAILMLWLLTFGAIPAACALMAATGDMPIPFNSRTPLIDKLGLATAWLTWIALGIGVLCLFVSCMYIATNKED